MPTFYSDQWKEDPYGGWNPTVERLDHVGVFQVTAKIQTTAALTTNDVLKMCPVQAGVRVKDVLLASDDIDSGTPAVVLEVGDTDGDPRRYITSTNIGQAGGIARMDNEAGVDYQLAADGSIDVTVATAAGTAAAGTVTLIVYLAADDLPKAA